MPTEAQTETTPTASTPDAETRIVSLKQGPLILTPNRGAITIKTGVVYRDLEIETSLREIDQEARTVHYTLSSEAVIGRWWGNEILDHQKSSIRMERTGRFFPLLLEHSPSQHIGVFERVWLEQKQLHGMARFGTKALSEEAFQDHIEGLKGLTSVGYKLHHIVLEEEDDGWPTYRIMDWEPLECSSVAVPADITVGIVEGDRALGRGGLPLYTRPGEWLPGQRGDFETRVTRAVKTKPVISTPAARSLISDEERGDEAVPTTDTPTTPTAPSPPAEPVTVKRAEEPRQPEPKHDRNREVARMLHLGDTYKNPKMARSFVEKGASESELLDALFEWRSTGDPTRDQPTDLDVGLSDREAQAFSFVRAINYIQNPDDRSAREDAAYELEVSEATEQKLRQKGFKMARSARSVLIPREIQRRSMFADMYARDRALRGDPRLLHMGATQQRAVLQAGTASLGEELVQTSVLGADFIDVLRSLTPIGSRVRVMRDLTSSIAIPRKLASAGLAATATENADAAEATITFDQVPGTPHRMAAYVDVSKQLLIQGTPDAEMLIGEDLMEQARVYMENQTYNGTGGSGQAEGIRNATGVSTVALGGVPTHGHMVDMETAVANLNGNVGDLLYVTTPGIKGVLKQTAIGTDMALVWPPTEDIVNGYPAFATTLMPSTLGGGTDHGILFGNFREVVWLFWAVMELTVDETSKPNARAFQATIVLNQLYDVIVRHGTSFAKTDDATLS